MGNGQQFVCGKKKYWKRRLGEGGKRVPKCPQKKYLCWIHIDVSVIRHCTKVGHDFGPSEGTGFCNYVMGRSGRTKPIAARDQGDIVGPLFVSKRKERGR